MDHQPTPNRLTEVGTPWQPSCRPIPNLSHVLLHSYRFFSENDCARRLLVLMEYRGKRYTIVQGIDRNSWKWKVQLDERTVRFGESPTSEAAKHSAVWAVDKALAPKMVKLQPQADTVS
jgi:hypothetical protein